MRRARLSIITTLAVTGAVIAVVVPASATSQVRRPRLTHPEYYLSLGGSDSVGDQPESGTTNAAEPTDVGFANQFLSMARKQDPQLQLVELGCPGETTETFIAGGQCAYSRGSQLSQALTFLAQHRGAVRYITVIIGGNDYAACGGSPACVAPTLPRITEIASALRKAAGPKATIIGLNYYDPYLSTWLSGPAGQAKARASVPAVVTFNKEIRAAYQKAGVATADVQDAFFTTDLTDTAPLYGVGLVPLDVATVCDYLWSCDVSGGGAGNVHPNYLGYHAMARAIARVAHLRDEGVGSIRP